MNSIMTSTFPKRKLEVQLSVDSRLFKSCQIEDILSISADIKWDAGQSYLPAPNSTYQYYQFSRWAIREVAGSLDELARSIQLVMIRTRDIADRFQLLPREAIVNLTVFATESDSIFGYGFDRDMIKWLGTIGAGLEFSMVMTAPDSPEQYSLRVE